MMKGKVFPGSTSLHEDKARLLFDYFKGAAQRIVTQELEFEARIDEQRREVVRLKEKGRKDLLLKGLVGGLVGLLILGYGLYDLIANGGAFVISLVGFVVGLVAGLLVFLDKRKETAGITLAETKIATFEEEHRNIRRDFKVHRVGTVYVPVATRVPFRGRSFLLDHTRQVPTQNFTLAEIRDVEELKQAVSSMDSLLEAIPAVDGGTDSETIDTNGLSRSIPKITMNEWSASLDRQLRKINYLFQDLIQTSIDIPIIAPDSEYARFLEEYAADARVPSLELKVFPTENLESALQGFQKLADLSDSKTTGNERGVEDFCRSIMKKSSNTLQLLSQTRAKSLQTLNLITEGFFSSVAKASFNYYNPVAEAESIDRIRQETFNLEDSAENYENLELKKSSKMSYDPISDNWVAEDGSRSSFPFGMSQVFEEVFVPMITNLMQENRLERLKIYNAIKDQKTDYLNQWHRDTDTFYASNRAEINEIFNRIRTISSDFMSDLNTFKAYAETLKNMRRGQSSADVSDELKMGVEELAAFEAQAQVSQAFLAQFGETLDNIKDEINTLAHEFEHIEFFEASLRDGEARDYALAMGRTDYDERQKKLLALGPQIASGGNLPPVPQVSDQVERDLLINLDAVFENTLQQILESERTLTEKAAAKVADEPAPAPQPEPTPEPEATAPPSAEPGPEEEDEDDEDDEEDEEDEEDDSGKGKR
ncbi:MAG: hypothetical protein WCG80_02970 [Spirochaetales bacterium]